MRIRELPEEHELLRRWCEGLDQEYRGQRLAGLAHEVFLKLLKAKREAPTAARQEVLAVQQGLCALVCGCTASWTTLCRCGSSYAPFPLPILCPADGVEPVEPGRLPDLGYVEGCRDARQAALQLLPFVGPGWYPKVSIAAMLETGVCRWDHIPLGIYARGHVGAATLRRALERMDAAWPEGEEHMAKLSVNAMIGLWARRADVIYSVRSSSCQLDGPGADFTQSFCYGEGSVWDFVYTRRLLTNGTYRPIHDAVLGFEHCTVAKARRLLAAPPRYVKQVKTDCLLLQGLPKSRQESVEALTRLRRQDGAPVFRVEECKALLGRSAPPRMEAERPALRRTPWSTARPATPCCSPACRAPGRRTLRARSWRGSVSRARRCTWCRRRIALRRTWGLARRRPTGCAGTSATGACKNLTGSWLRRSPSWTWRSGRTWRAWG